jgi:hypothetical protein
MSRNYYRDPLSDLLLSGVSVKEAVMAGEQTLGLRISLGQCALKA